MNTIFGSVLEAWASPTYALIAVVILSAFGYWLYHWVRQEPKAPGGALGADAKRWYERL
ncbi:MAG: hypothetical protein ACREV3_01545 [Gammaproteobacteria bacterium]